MEHRDKIVFEHIDATGRGLEIGAGYQPLAPKSKGFNCATLDYASAEVLKENLAKDNLAQELIDQVEDVDYVWRGEALPDLVAEKFDYVLASHVLEHSVDLIAFLNDCQELLRPGGLIGIILPDKRFCFDTMRPISTIGQVIDNHDRNLRYHSVGTIIDQYAYAVKRADRIAWSHDSNTGDFSMLYGPLDGSKSDIAIAQDQQEYLDRHHWVFTPGSFQLLIRDLTELGYLNLTPVANHETVLTEFFVTLAAADTPGASKIDRPQALRDIQDELAVEYLDTIAELRNELVAKQASLAEVERTLVATQRELARTLQSTSWKVTQPLRRLTGLAKR